MASLAKIFRLGPNISRSLLHVRPQNTVLAANAGYWNKDWAAGPFPKTPEEKAAAAKKYGLRKEDYEPYPDDGTGLGDYPKLPYVSAESRDPYYDYDYPELRRNFGEPLNAEFEIIGEDRWNPNSQRRFSLTTQFMWFSTVMGSIIAAYLFFEQYPTFTPIMPKQKPFKINEDGQWELQKHYTFEPVE